MDGSELFGEAVVALNVTKEECWLAVIYSGLFRLSRMLACLVSSGCLFLRALALGGWTSSRIGLGERRPVLLVALGVLVGMLVELLLKFLFAFDVCLCMMVSLRLSP